MREKGILGRGVWKRGYVRLLRFYVVGVGEGYGIMKGKVSGEVRVM